MLHHPWSTQKNEAMNKSVSSYAPKDRTFSTTNSLLTRVSIAGAVQGANNFQVWTNIFREIRLLLDQLLELFFSNMSERAGKILREDMAAMGPVRLSDVDEAQLEIVNSAKQLAEQGELILSESNDEDELVY